MYSLSSLAEDDIYQIAIYTITHFGIHQAEKYQRELTETLTLLSNTPQIGRECSWVKAGIRSFTFKKHTIYYLEQENNILIARVIHQSMDVEYQDFSD